MVRTKPFQPDSARLVICPYQQEITLYIDQGTLICLI